MPLTRPRAIDYETARDGRGARRLAYLVRAVAAGLLAAALVAVTGWVPTEVFPRTSRGVLMWPSIPAVCAAVLAGWAVDLFRGHRTRAWAVGLWAGACVALVIFCFWAV